MSSLYCSQGWFCGLFSCFCILTRRFFSTCSSGHRTMDSALKHLADAPTPTHSVPSQSNKSGGSVGCDTPSPPPSQSLTSPRPASQGFRLFDWPSNVPSTKLPPNLKLPSGSTEEIPANASRSSRDQSAASTNTDSSEDPPDSPVSQDSAYWSQSQPYKSPYYKKEEQGAAFVSPLNDRQEFLTGHACTCVLVDSWVICCASPGDECAFRAGTACPTRRRSRWETETARIKGRFARLSKILRVSGCISIPGLPLPKANI